jgi:glycosyltransferase involved in cell wall biosynthesis
VRVLFVNPLGALGGSERSLLDLLAALGREGATVERRLLLMAGGELENEARALGVRVDLLPMPRALVELGEMRAEAGRRGSRAFGLGRAALVTAPYLAAFRRAVRRTAPDIVHTNGMKAHAAALLAVPELPRVIHLRDFASQRPLTRHLLGLGSRRSVVVANSEAVAADFRALSPRSRTRVVYNGIDTALFADDGLAPAPLAELAGLPVPPGGALCIGLVATYAWWKGHRTFIAAAARLRALTPTPLRFYVIGGPTYGAHGSEVSRSELEALVQSSGLSGEVGLVPFQRDVPNAIRALDIVVHASERPEPFGRVIVEGMAAGKPVVVSRAGGALELFREGTTGVGFTPGDPEALARALLSLVSDAALRQRLGTAAQDEARRRFDRARLAQEMIAVYRMLGA